RRYPRGFSWFSGSRHKEEWLLQVWVLQRRKGLNMRLPMLFPLRSWRRSPSGSGGNSLLCRPSSYDSCKYGMNPSSFSCNHMNIL
ncbi:UNVERIFIED_CONTAM: hypothetical protein Sangu_2062500, partial [Sesamum angustifolium]